MMIVAGSGPHGRRGGFRALPKAITARMAPVAHRQVRYADFRGGAGGNCRSRENGRCGETACLVARRFYRTRRTR